jgi:NAD(P)-dependent dehydrogenase (short-subunit alcohol dehydrogenase family)
MSMPDVRGKKVIVTGAGSGLGRAMALGLCEAGADVLALDIAEDRANDTAATAQRYNNSSRVIAFRCDVRRTEDCGLAVEAAISQLGGLHGLVNCAGLGMPHLRRDAHAKPVHFWEADPDRWQEIIDVNIRGPFLLARAATPHLIAQGWGRIVNVTTSFNTMIRTANMPYGQTKAALEAASASWAEDLRGKGVSVNVLIPGGAADTRMIPEESGYDRSKLVSPQVMVAPIRWLMSQESDGVTGMRFVGRQWSPDLAWQEAAKVSGAPIAWPALAAEAAGGQPVSIASQANPTKGVRI